MEHPPKYYLPCKWCRGEVEEAHAYCNKMAACWACGRQWRRLPYVCTEEREEDGCTTRVTITVAWVRKEDK